MVLGASEGIGRATALNLRAKGYATVLSARTRSALEDVARESGGGQDVFVVPGDITSRSFRADLVAAAERRFGRIDVLINNAPGPAPGSFDSTDPADVTTAMERKLVPYLDLIKSVAPVMARNEFGRIVNIVGNIGKEPASGMFLSGLVNAAVSNASKYLASQYAKDNVTVNCVHPGPFGPSATTGPWSTSAGPAESRRTRRRTGCGAPSPWPGRGAPTRSPPSSDSWCPTKPRT
ncbi:SDR family NAD(P)-dependent oxidoreductase [Streptomyces sp. MS1.HAVA.3]|uniref:SDR family NAD(P)-dependent oxidoreductase n=1 Tax=Streptomyces caledonius TaxID=3134107 RepID=A0ABU8U0Q0_9ACTN